MERDLAVAHARTWTHAPWTCTLGPQLRPQRSTRPYEVTQGQRIGRRGDAMATAHRCGDWRAQCKRAR